VCITGIRTQAQKAEEASMPEERKRQTLTAREGGSRTIEPKPEQKATQKPKTPAIPPKEEKNVDDA